MSLYSLILSLKPNGQTRGVKWRQYGYNWSPSNWPNIEDYGQPLKLSKTTLQPQYRWYGQHHTPIITYMYMHIHVHVTCACTCMQVHLHVYAGACSLLVWNLGRRMTCHPPGIILSSMQSPPHPPTPNKKLQLHILYGTNLIYHINSYC